MVWDDEQGAYWEFLLEPKAVTAIAGGGGKEIKSVPVVDNRRSGLGCGASRPGEANGSCAVM